MRRRTGEVSWNLRRRGTRRKKLVNGKREGEIIVSTPPVRRPYRIKVIIKQNE